MKPKVLVVFYSRTGNIARLADAEAEGARSIGAEVKLARVDDLAPESVINANTAWRTSRNEQKQKYPEAEISDLEWADAVIFGSPTRYGNMAAEMKLYIDKTAGLWVAGKLQNKPASAFTSTATMHGGNETTLLSFYMPMTHLGMIIVPPGYSDPVMFQAGTPYGASAVVGGDASIPPTDMDLQAARHQGRRVATVAEALLSSK
jgi:NAD(P)H dehydrogenase (quinone)